MAPLSSFDFPTVDYPINAADLLSAAAVPAAAAAASPVPATSAITGSPASTPVTSLSARKVMEGHMDSPSEDQQQQHPDEADGACTCSPCSMESPLTSELASTASSTASSSATATTARTTLYSSSSSSLSTTTSAHRRPRVSFNDHVDTIAVPHREDMPHRDDIWWNASEYKLMRQMIAITLQLMQRGHALDDGIDFCTRGLQCKHDRMHTRQSRDVARLAVLRAQHFQRVEGFRDDAYVAQVYTMNARASRQVAQEMAVVDAAVAREQD